MAEEVKLSLAAKLAKIGKEIGVVKKGGRNDQQKYDFIEYSVVAGRIRELFDEYGVIIKPEVKDYQTDEVENKFGNKGYHYILKMKFTIINSDDKEDKQEADWLGESTDYGDKGINKAETSGVKYFLMRLFNISEKGDQEADAIAPEMVARHSTGYPAAPDQHPAYQNNSSSEGRLDFDRLKTRLLELHTVEEVDDAKRKLDEKFPNLTDKQKNAINRIFSERKDQITEPLPKGWAN